LTVFIISAPLVAAGLGVPDVCAIDLSFVYRFKCPSDATIVDKAPGTIGSNTTQWVIGTSFRRDTLIQINGEFPMRGLSVGSEHRLAADPRVPQHSDRRDARRNEALPHASLSALRSTFAELRQNNSILKFADRGIANRRKGNDTLTARGIGASLFKDRCVRAPL
jgi:hypothetical protein